MGYRAGMRFGALLSYDQRTVDGVTEKDTHTNATMGGTVAFLPWVKEDRNPREWILVGLGVELAVDAVLLPAQGFGAKAFVGLTFDLNVVRR